MIKQQQQQNKKQEVYLHVASIFSFSYAVWWVGVGIIFLVKPRQQSHYQITNFTSLHRLHVNFRLIIRGSAYEAFSAPVYIRMKVCNHC